MCILVLLPNRFQHIIHKGRVVCVRKGVFKRELYLSLCPAVGESSKETILEVHHAHSLSQHVTHPLPASAAANLRTHIQTKTCLVVHWE